MISVEEAKARILSAFTPLAAETVNVADALGRVLAEDLTARVTQPPGAVSAMDGYAVREADLPELNVVGVSYPGSGYDGTLGTALKARLPF